MVWRDQKAEDVTWWDVAVPILESHLWIKENNLQDNALLDQEMHNWLFRLPHNCGYRKASDASTHSINGEHFIDAEKFVRFYDRYHAIHFALVWT